MRRYLLTLSIFLFCITLAGCATAKKKKPLEVEGQNNGAVVGDVSFAEYTGSYEINVRDLMSGKVYNITEKNSKDDWEEEEGGFARRYFCKELPPGRYSIVSTQLIDSSHQAPYRSDFRFIVEPFKATSIGMLIYDWKQMNARIDRDYSNMFNASISLGEDAHDPCASIRSRAAFQNAIRNAPKPAAHHH